MEGWLSLDLFRSFVCRLSSDHASLKRGSHEPFDLFKKGAISNLSGGNGCQNEIPLLQAPTHSGRHIAAFRC